MQTLPLVGYVYTVTSLTEAIKLCLEERFRSFWIEGQISNFRVPTSGHFYFTLKDQESHIRAVMFRSRNVLLRFVPSDGMQVLCRASLSVYAPRGEYQLIVELMEPKGIGALQLAFEALKQKLAAEGLFDAARKKQLPLLPRMVGVVTSPVGAAIRDIVKVIWRRFPNVEIRLRPVRVQGEGAAEEIARAIADVNEDGQADVIIVGRGGGSLEDLWAFNEEVVARAIAASHIPVVSAVGHEVDFTIADFVADVRASTPSAAAETVVPEKEHLEVLIESMTTRLLRACRQMLDTRKAEIRLLTSRLISPMRRLQDLRIRIDDLSEDLSHSVGRMMEAYRKRVLGCREKLIWLGPLSTLKTFSVQVEGLKRELFRVVVTSIEVKKQQYRSLVKCLENLSPLRVLARGYSITRLLPERTIVRAADQVRKGDRVEVMVAHGLLECSIDEIKEGGAI